MHYTSQFTLFLLGLLVLSFSITAVHCHKELDACKASYCKKDGAPEIRFPFRIKETQPRSCGLRGFDLSCRGEDTFISLPSTRVGADHVLLQVRTIDYKEQKLYLDDPNHCLLDLLLFHNNTPNYSSPPFFAPPPYTDSILLSCSKNAYLANFVLFSRISCLSNEEQVVLVARSDDFVAQLPVSCQPTKRFSFPLAYFFDMPFLDMADVLFVLKWDVPGCNGCEFGGGRCVFVNQNNTTSQLATCLHIQTGSNRKFEIIGGCLGSFFLFVAIIISIKIYRSSKLNKKLDLENEMFIEKFLEDYESLMPTRYSYADLRRITNQFKEKLGQGGFGNVFKGKLPNKTPVAVKILHSYGGNGEEFMNEVGTIGRIYHVNVVRLLGFCADRLKRALVYEYMPNESLEKFISFRNYNADSFLGWKKLQDIAIGVARGIEYLHQGCEKRILHFDIKPHNILLDKNFIPKISDFGLAKLCSKGQSAVSITAARGTMGYIAPEVFSRSFGNVSYKADVYSFGMLLLEMVGGRENIDVNAPRTSQVYFPELIYKRLCEGEEMGIANISTVEEAKIARKLTNVALWCIQWHPTDRPSMKSVLQMLEGSIEILTMPPDPFASTTDRAITEVQRTHITNLSTILE